MTPSLLSYVSVDMLKALLPVANQMLPERDDRSGSASSGAYCHRALMRPGSSARTRRPRERR